MKAKIVRIGNSQGIRIPKPLIRQAGLSEEVELKVRDGEIVISPAVGCREGWAEAAHHLASAGDNQLLDEQDLTRFDSEEWEW